MHVIYGTGPLGQAVAAAILARGGAVRLVNRSGRPPVGFTHVETVAGDLTDTASARQAASGASVIYHCASVPYSHWAMVLPVLMEGAIDAAASVRAKLVYGDNLYAYAPSDEPLAEDAPERPVTRKGQVRKQVADALRNADRNGRVQAAIGRSSDFYGPAVLYSAVGSEVFGRLAGKKAPRALGNPDQLHSFTFIEDFGRALVTLAEHDEAFGATWHVPNAPPVTTRNFAAQSARAMGSDLPVKNVPSWLLRTLGPFHPTLLEVAEMLYQWERPFIVDDGKFKRVFGDAFGAATPLADGIARTAAWFAAGSSPAA